MPRKQSVWLVRLRKTHRFGLLAASFFVTSCATGRFRYDRLNEEQDKVDLRDLEDLIRDGRGELARPSGSLGVSVEQIAYDFSAEQDEYRLGKNDVLNIFVLDHPELSSQRVNLGEISGTTIRKDGQVHLPIVGSIAAEGLTLTEFEASLTEAISKYIIDPKVNVEILKFESQKFYVLGELPQPGAFAVDGDTTLLEALSLAGGVPPSANLESATVVRAGQLLPINLADLVRRGDVSRNIFMRAGDLIYVPDNADQKVFVLGEVNTPGVIRIERNRITLAEALASAGGPAPARARRELAVIRGGFAKPLVYRLDLEKALLVDDEVLLRPGDRVVVAPTGLSTASRYMQQILPFLMGAQAAGLAAQGATSVTTQAAALSN